MNFLAGRGWIGLGVFALLCTLANAQEKPLASQVAHLNIVFMASDQDDVHRFYGDILGLKRIPNIDLPGDSVMIRYLGGESEIKFIVSGQTLPKYEGGTQAARGIRLLAFLFPDSERSGMLQRLQANGREVPEFTTGTSPAGYTYSYGMLYDGDGNQVEIVFLSDDAPAEKFKQIQIGLNVSQQSAMDQFLVDVLGFQPEVTDGPIHRQQMGVSQLKYWQGKAELPALTGNPMAKLGMNLIQFLVPDVDAVRAMVIEKGGKIHTEPFPLGTLATIMFVEGPDGIVFEFAGPLLDRFKKK